VAAAFGAGGGDTGTVDTVLTATNKAGTPIAVGTNPYAILIVP
jgi:hypothetical protein